MIRLPTAAVNISYAEKPAVTGFLHGRQDEIMNKEYLNLLEKIRDTLNEIQALREDLSDLLDAPAITLENLEKLRDTLEEIQLMQEDTDV